MLFIILQPHYQIVIESRRGSKDIALYIIPGYCSVKIMLQT